jgi:hypothetical protein
MFKTSPLGIDEIHAAIVGLSKTFPFESDEAPGAYG